MTSFFKLLLSLFIFFIGLAALAAGGGAYYANSQFNQPGPLSQKTLFTVKRGAHIGAVAQDLKEAGIIKDSMVFKYMGKITGKAEKIKAGEYEFAAQISMIDILNKLEKGEVFTRKVTVREGLTNYEIKRLLLQQKDLEIEGVQKYPEGRLLPETYSYARGDSNADIIARMASAMDKVLDEAWEKRAQGLPIKTKEDALILASIIEKETAVASERKRVAGVFINRLRKGIPLQSDPTVIYALTDGKPENNGKGPLGRRLLTKDLEIDSPYNTYKNAGLPPMPIANPGRASIEAALNPEEHKYLYFVADGSGGHAFAETLNEHNNNVAKWRRIRRQQKK